MTNLRGYPSTSRASTRPPGHGLRTGLLGLGICLLFLFGLGNLDLWDPDEANYAEIAREMAFSGDWIVPHSNYRPYLEKPPLTFWMAAGAMRLIGPGETAARLPAAISGLLLVLVGALWARRALPGDALMSAALVLGTSLGIVATSRLGILDLPLTACSTVSLLGFERRVLAGGGRIGWLCFYAGMAAGCLTKGLIGILLPLAAAGITLLWVRPSGLWKRLDPLPGLSLMLFPVIVWFLIAELNAPGFFREFVIEHHFSRYLGDGIVHRRSFPAWTYVPLLLAAGLPWSVFWPSSLADAWRSARGREPLSTFLLVAALFPLIFFSFSATRLPQYVLPALPFLGLLVARRVTDARLPARWITAVALAGALMFLALDAGVAAPVNSRRSIRPLALAAARHAIPGERLLSYRLGHPFASVFYSGRRIRFVEEEVTFDQFVSSPRRFWILIDEEERSGLERRHQRPFEPVASHAGRHLITNLPAP
ncbi:MAG: glycosyltransferase family 39 protein [Acidobacteriota bacterium]